MMIVIGRKLSNYNRNSCAVPDLGFSILHFHFEHYMLDLACEKVGKISGMSDSVERPVLALC